MALSVMEKADLVNKGFAACLYKSLTREACCDNASFPNIIPAMIKCADVAQPVEQLIRNQ
jgi:hypothetical protein